MAEGARCHPPTHLEGGACEHAMLGDLVQPLHHRALHRPVHAHADARAAAANRAGWGG